MGIYEVYIDKGEECKKVVVPGRTGELAGSLALAINEEDGQAGEVVAAREMTAKYLFDTEELCRALDKADYDEGKKRLLLWVLYTARLTKDAEDAEA
jgi:hypothetical protein